MEVKKKEENWGNLNTEVPSVRMSRPKLFKRILTSDQKDCSTSYSFYYIWYTKFSTYNKKIEEQSEGKLG